MELVVHFFVESFYLSSDQDATKEYTTKESSIPYNSQPIASIKGSLSPFPRWYIRQTRLLKTCQVDDSSVP